EIRTEHVDRPTAEIGGKQERLAGGTGREREPLVEGPGGRAVNRQEGPGRINGGGPAGDGAVFGGEQEAARRGNAVFRDGKPGPAVEDRAGRGAARARG